MNNSGIAYEGGSVDLYARFRDPNTGDYPTVAGIASISVVVLDSTTAEVIVTYSPAAEDVLYDTLQTDDNWIGDRGFNNHLTLSGSSLPEVGDYVVTETITPVTGNAYPIVWRLQVLPNEDD